MQDVYRAREGVLGGRAREGVLGGREREGVLGVINTFEPFRRKV